MPGAAERVHPLPVCVCACLVLHEGYRGCPLYRTWRPLASVRTLSFPGSEVMPERWVARREKQRRPERGALAGAGHRGRRVGGEVVEGHRAGVYEDWFLLARDGLHHDSDHRRSRGSWAGCNLGGRRTAARERPGVRRRRLRSFLSWRAIQRPSYTPDAEL